MADGFARLLVERYLKTRGYRVYSSQSGEFLINVHSAAGPFQVYLKTRSAGSIELIKVRARSSLRVPASQRHRLLELSNRHNDENQWLTASVRDGEDEKTLRVVGNSRLAVTADCGIDVVRNFIDLAVASGAKLFEMVDSEMKLPSPSELQDWFEKEVQ